LNESSVFSGSAMGASRAAPVRQREFALYMKNLDMKCRVLHLSRSASLSSVGTHWVSFDNFWCYRSPSEPMPKNS